MGDMAGTTLAHYQITEKLGEGGMGVVYRARDTRLDRDVAIKVLPEQVAVDPERVKRFEREAKAVAALNHPNVVTIHSVEEAEGIRFLTMEIVEGTTLSELIPPQGQSLEDFLTVAMPVADALRLAHDRGIVHRDLKPGNVMVTEDGLVKVMDFGLAKLFAGGDIDDSAATQTASQTAVGIILGTAAYMSPEQAEGKPVGPPSDIFSLGTMFYEMLTGERPFTGDSKISIMSAILNESPARLKDRRRDLPKDVVRVVDRCLEKSPDARYLSAGELWQDLQRSRKRHAAAEASLLSVLRRPRVAVPALVILALVTAVGGWLWTRGSRARWAEREALPGITRLTEEGDIHEAYLLALEAKKVLPENPDLQKMLERITLPLPVVTEPAGADIFIKGFQSPDAPWQFLGRTPLETRIPYALVRWRITKEGFEDFEGAPFGEGPLMTLATGLPLEPVGTRPEGMVRVPPVAFQRPDFPMVQLDTYWIDRYEVTNVQFKEFVDAGGYQRREYWKEPFFDNQDELTWEEGIEVFQDTTGRPGPATWELGSYPEGQGDSPVGGVSWYEAAAYCEFAGKRLPTVYHWYGATSQDQISDIVNFSNFDTDGPAPVGSYPGLGDWGTYDMAGNVKEWCWNATGDKRYILGGAWGEPTYLFKEPDARSPFEREPTHGFRCARPIGDPVDDALLAPVTPSWEYFSHEPVGEEIFEAYRRLYAYDRTELAAEVEAVDDSSTHWIKETVSFDAAYGKERVIAYVFLPRDAEPPYQAVVVFPGSDVFLSHTSESLASAYLFDFIPRSGRALVYPIYKAMYERFVPLSGAPNETRDMMIMWSKDLGRTVDYLETREDIDHEKLAYYGFSLGAVHGPVFTSVDDRFRASVLYSGGLHEEVPPEMDVINFAPRCRVPTLMINGRDDFLLPVETSQRPFFEMLGVTGDDKRHVLLEGGHLPPNRREVIREVLDWLDRYLGPVTPR